MQNRLEAIAQQIAQLDQAELEAKLALFPEPDRQHLRQLVESRPWPADTLHATFQSRDTDPNSALNQTESFGDPGESTQIHSASVSSPADPYATDRIGEYQILNTIAVHGQGAVYRADHPHLNRQVVIKVSKEKVDASKQEHVLAEGRTLASLSHPNLAQVYDLQFDDGRPYLVMEYIEGRNLAEKMKSGQPISPQQAADLVATVAHAIEHAHSLGVVHQDLKPANIVIRAADGTPKVIDFGLAKAKTAYSEEDLLSTYGGTIAYMAPEQAQQIQALRKGEPVAECDERVDVFALGAILYELLTGKRLYSFRDQHDGLKQAVDCDFDRGLLNPVSATLRNACLKALAKDPAERWSSAQQFAEALQQPKSAWSPASRLVLPAAVLAPLVFAAFWFAFGQPEMEKGITADRAPSGSGVQNSSETPESKAQAPPKPVTPPLAPGLLPGVRFTHIANSTEGGFAKPLFENGFVRENDDLRIEAKFNRPRYCFLFAVNPDGVVQLCYPEGGDEAWDVVQTEPVEELNYPADSRFAFGFTDGVGQQAFVLVRSLEPLPSFRDWSRETLQLHPTMADASGRWIWQQGMVRPAPNPRTATVRGGPRPMQGVEPFDEVMHSIDQANPGLEISGLSFPVAAK